MPKFKDNRYSRSIKVAMNKLFQNKPVVHKHIAQLISEFSHKTLLTNGSYLLNRRLQFFVVRKILSSHFCSGFYCPSRIDLLSSGYYYVPNIWYKSRPLVKNFFKPFSKSPFIKQRNNHFFLRGLKRYGAVQPFNSILEQMY